MADQFMSADTPHATIADVGEPCGVSVDWLSTVRTCSCCGSDCSGGVRVKPSKLLPQHRNGFYALCRTCAVKIGQVAGVQR